MNADTATPPTTPTPPGPAPVGGSLPVLPGAATPPVSHEHVKAEPNALLEGTKKVWANVKAGKVGNPRVILLVLAAGLIAAAVWFLMYANHKNDSDLWSKYDQVVANDDLKKFADDPSNANTVAAKIARFNDQRLRKDLALRNMTHPKKGERVAAANALEKLRDELEQTAGQFDKDPTLKAQAYLAAADIEMGLIGVPKESVLVTGGKERELGRGQTDKYAGLLRKAAEALPKVRNAEGKWDDSEAAKALLAKAEKYNGAEAAALYIQLGGFHAKFNEADPVPVNTGDPNTPKLPDAIGGTPKADPNEAPKPPAGLPDAPKAGVPPGEAPKPPANPLPTEKK